MADEAEILLSVEEGVATVTLNRPEALNAFSAAMMDALPVMLAKLANDPAVRCVILTGAGRGFCAGADLRLRQQALDEMAALPQDERLAATRLDSLEMKLTARVEASRMLHTMRKPTIAAINGPCAGAGFCMAGACDFRVAGESALLTSAFMRAGLSGDYGGTYFWTKILGTAQARELYMLSPKIGADEALRRGMVHYVVPNAELAERARALARQLLEMPAWALNYAKRNLNLAEEGTLERVLELETLSVGVSARAARESGRPPSAVLSGAGKGS
ncbi:MAG: enoyl-CoA hydratase-related protein [Pseudomonadota bacterium]